MATTVDISDIRKISQLPPGDFEAHRATIQIPASAGSTSTYRYQYTEMEDFIITSATQGIGEEMDRQIEAVNDNIGDTKQELYDEINALRTEIYDGTALPSAEDYAEYAITTPGHTPAMDVTTDLNVVLGEIYTDLAATRNLFQRINFMTDAYSIMPSTTEVKITNHYSNAYTSAQMSSTYGLLSATSARAGILTSDLYNQLTSSYADSLSQVFTTNTILPKDVLGQKYAITLQEMPGATSDNMVYMKTLVVNSYGTVALYTGQTGAYNQTSPDFITISVSNDNNKNARMIGLLPHDTPLDYYVEDMISGPSSACYFVDEDNWPTNGDWVTIGPDPITSTGALIYYINDVTPKPEGIITYFEPPIGLTPNNFQAQTPEGTRSLIPTTGLEQGTWNYELMYDTSGNSTTLIAEDYFDMTIEDLQSQIADTSASIANLIEETSEFISSASIGFDTSGNFNASFTNIFDTVLVTYTQSILASEERAGFITSTTYGILESSAYITSADLYYDENQDLIFEYSTINSIDGTDATTSGIVMSPATSTNSGYATSSQISKLEQLYETTQSYSVYSFTIDNEEVPIENKTFSLITDYTLSYTPIDTTNILGVAISQDENNILEVMSDGLRVPVYGIQAMSSTSTIEVGTSSIESETSTIILKLDVNIDATDNNVLSYSTSGLYVEPLALNINTTSTNTIINSANVTDNVANIKLDVNINTVDNNLLMYSDNGLLVSPINVSGQVNSNSDTISGSFDWTSGISTNYLTLNLNVSIPAITSTFWLSQEQGSLYDLVYTNENGYYDKISYLPGQIATSSDGSQVVAGFLEMTSALAIAGIPGLGF